MGEIASVLLTMGTGGAGGAGAAGMTAMATGAGVEGAAGAALGGTAAGGMGAALGVAESTGAFAPEAVAAEAAESANATAAVAPEAVDLDAIMQDPSLMVNDEAAIKEAAESSQSSSGFGLNDVKDFFSQTWDNAKNDLGKNVVRDADGSINAGKTAGNFGYGIAKSALLKAINSKDQEMPNPNQDQPQPMKFSPPEISNAEDELNKLRNRMNVS